MRYTNIVMSLFCAWVLWNHGVIISRDAGVEHIWHPVDAFDSKAECNKESQATKDKNKKEAEKEGQKHFHDDYRCLPETVDPRAPKAGK